MSNQTAIPITVTQRDQIRIWSNTHYSPSPLQCASCNFKERIAGRSPWNISLNNHDWKGRIQIQAKFRGPLHAYGTKERGLTLVWTCKQGWYLCRVSQVIDEFSDSAWISNALKSAGLVLGKRVIHIKSHSNNTLHVQWSVAKDLLPQFKRV